MRPRRRWPILLAAGLVLVIGSLVLVRWLNRPPRHPDRFHWDEAEIERGFERLREEKDRCEDLIRSSLRRDRPHFEAIVKSVEKQGLAEDQSAQFYFPKGGSPDPLRKTDESFDRQQLGEFCERNTLVNSYRRGGVLFVKVVVCEMGHAGTYAVMYSSKELTEKEIQDQLVPCAVERLDPHWWAVIEWY